MFYFLRAIRIFTLQVWSIKGYLKAKMYERCPWILEASKKVITKLISVILPEMTRNVIDNYLKRVNQCIHKGCHHLSDVTFKTKLNMSYLKKKKIVFSIMLSIGFYYLP